MSNVFRNVFVGVAGPADVFGSVFDFTPQSEEIEDSMVSWLETISSLPAHYQHIARHPGESFLWFIRSGDEDLDTLDSSGEPEIVYFDVELYAASASEILILAALFRTYRDYRGAFGTAWADDISIDDQRDDYETQAAAETLPAYSAVFRVGVSGYTSNSFTSSTVDTPTALSDSLEVGLVDWLSTVTSLDVHYQHLDRQPVSEFLWFIRSGDEDLDSLDGYGEPDVVYFDVEIYAQSVTSLQNITSLLRAQRDYGGVLGNGTVDDIAINDQRDDYEPQAAVETLPPYAAAFRLTVSGFET